MSLEQTINESNITDICKPIMQKHKNKGTGAGGSNTNKNGLSYEEITNLDDRIETIQEENIKIQLSLIIVKKFLLKLKKLIFLNV